MLNKKALAASVSAPPAEYVEDVFSTYLYTGTGSNQTITNNIDLSGKGGLVWQKGRSSVSANTLIDTVRGGGNYLISNTDAAQVNTTALTFSSTGFTTQGTWQNTNAATYASWTFREQAKFFDVVTYTGNGTNRTIAHNLGSVPGMIIVKRTDTTGDWQVYHRANTAAPETDYLVLNSTAATADSDTRWNDTLPTSTVFSLGTDATVNANGGTYVAYLFAHDAGGFGTAGTDNVISCGSFTTDANGDATVNLGYEPQYILYKRSSSTGSWYIFDNMRGMANQGSTAATPTLFANVSNAETANAAAFFPTATGFQMYNQEVSSTLIYMAIRRPMKTPTSGTEVYYAGTGNGSTTVPAYVTNFPVDAGMLALTRTTPNSKALVSRLIGNQIAYMNSTSAYSNETDVAFDSSVGYMKGNWGGAGGYTEAFTWALRRATGFFDMVCYTGTGSQTAFSHNLGVAPELVIIKKRNTSSTLGWIVGTKFTSTNFNFNLLNTTDADGTYNYADVTTFKAAPTSTTITLGTYTDVNASGSTYVAYLFATVAGVSKVGSYTGNGSNQTINCGFTAGARFVLIKRTDSTGDWYVYDTARGIVSGNDPQLKLNTTGAEATGYDAIDPDNSGFIVNNDATNFPINVNNATYIYLAIA